MKVNRLMQTITLAMKKGSFERGKYLKEKSIFANVGESVYFQPRLIPLYPELIKLHNNITWFPQGFVSSHMTRLLLF